MRVGGRPVDVRVSTLPTGHGERVVLRLLDKDLSKLELTNLGMAKGALDRFDTLIHQPHGIILVTGPTGSGKTTTLYAALRRLDKNTTNIMTVEDPIEYEIEGIGQMQVNPKIDMTFAKALRAILRQDPDVIMIGEIRDLETAQIAMQASLTGHLVLATLHTNDAASAVTRLIDMGIEPFLLSSSLLGVMAQRLVRKLCPKCRVQDSPTSPWRAVGCDNCGNTGYVGRTGIYELLTVDDEMRMLVHQGANDTDIRRVAEKGGMVNMRADAQRWVVSGRDFAGRSAASHQRVDRSSCTRRCASHVHSAALRVSAPGSRAAGRPARLQQPRGIDGCIQVRRGGHFGQGTDGVLEADSARVARQLLRGRGLIPLTVEPVLRRGCRAGPAWRSASAADCRRPNLRSSRASWPR